MFSYRIEFRGEWGTVTAASHASMHKDPVRHWVLLVDDVAVALRVCPRSPISGADPIRERGCRRLPMLLIPQPRVP